VNTGGNTVIDLDSVHLDSTFGLYSIQCATTSAVQRLPVRDVLLKGVECIG